MNRERKKIVVILGAGRSGSSLTTNIAFRLGLNLSEKLVGENKTNLKGAWEDVEILNISRDILKNVHRNSWKLSYLPMPDDWLEDDFVKTQMELLKGIIKDRLKQAGDRLWGFKEPVTVKMIPMWDIIFKELLIEPIYILSLRNPKNVIKSFKLAYNASAFLSEMLWLSRYTDVIRYTEGQFIVLDYDCWFTNPEMQAKKILSVLDIELNDDELKAIINDTIDVKLYTAKDTGLELNNEICNELYECLKSYTGAAEEKIKLLAINEKAMGYLSLSEGLATSIDFMGEKLNQKIEESARLKSNIGVINKRCNEEKNRIRKEANLIKKELKEISYKYKMLTNSCEMVADQRGISDQQEKFKFIENKIVAGVASFEKRIDVFKITVGSILPQVDHLMVYLNNYERIPEYLNDPKISIFKSQDYGDLSANGKIFYLDKLKSCYFFSIDDDIQYPTDYVSVMIHNLKKYENKVGVAVHGSIFPKEVEWYFERYSVYPFQQELKNDKFVTLIGSGTFAFHTDTLKTKYSDFSKNVMVDLRFSILAKQQKIPLVCISRPKLWLKALVQGDGLYQKFLCARTIHTEESVKHNPWGYETYKSFIQSMMEDVFSGIDDQSIEQLKLDKEFIESMQSGETPPDWLESKLYKRKVSDREAIFNPIENNRIQKRIINRLRVKNNQLRRKKDKLIRDNNRLKNSNFYKMQCLFSNAIRRPGINTLLLPYSVLKLILNAVLK